MTPQEKAKELFNKICKASEPMFYSSELVRSEWIKVCKEQTLIALNEILEAARYTYSEIKYWQEVKTEIEKL